MKSNVHSNRIPVAIMAFIAAVNIGLVVVLLRANFGDSGVTVGGANLYILAGLEFAVVVVAYLVGRGRNASLSA